MLDVSNISELLQSLKDDKAAADSNKSTWDTRREVWIMESNGEPYGNEVKGKSSIVTRDIKKAEVWQHATIIDPFVSNADIVRAGPISGEDDPLSDQSETLLNHFFCRKFDRYNFVSESFKIFQREGTVTARAGWEFAEEEVEVEVPVEQMMRVMGPQGPMMQPQIVGYKTELQMKTVLNQPTAATRDNKTLWIDPTEKQDIGKAQFCVEHFKTSMSQLKQEGIYENLDQIVIATSDSDVDDDETYRDSDDENFKFADDARAELDAYEYWGNYDVDDDGVAEPIICTWVGNVIIRLEENPYPDRELPYVSCASDPEPFSINGRPNADLQSADQKITTSITRSLMDTLDSSTNGQRGFKEGTLDPANERKFKAKKDFKFQSESPVIWEGKYADFNPSVMNFLEMTRNNQAELTGVKPFAGSNGSLGSATQANMAMGAVAKKEVDISRNFAENFIIPLLRKWLSMINEFMEPEEVERITGKPYVKPDPYDMGGFVDIRLEVATAETDMKKAQDINFMLQTNGPSLDFDMRKMLMVEQAELQKMPGLAAKLEALQPPPPDPLEQQMKMLEIEKLKAEIAERQSRAEENKVDMRLKEANTILAQAKTRELHSKADTADLDYTRTATGQSQQDALDMENRKTRNKMLEERDKPQAS